ncbi:hypothetical protein QE372_005145 [Agrobacterium pusense]|nr:hypothetical protein [Agrobacterium pusense]
MAQIIEQNSKIHVEKTPALERAQLAPQTITRNGKPSVVVVSAEEWQRELGGGDRSRNFSWHRLYAARIWILNGGTTSHVTCRSEAAPRHERSVGKYETSPG